MGFAKMGADGSRVSTFVFQFSFISSLLLIELTFSLFYLFKKLYFTFFIGYTNGFNCYIFSDCIDLKILNYFNHIVINGC